MLLASLAYELGIFVAHVLALAAFTAVAAFGMTWGGESARLFLGSNTKRAPNAEDGRPERPSTNQHQLNDPTPENPRQPPSHAHDAAVTTTHVTNCIHVFEFASGYRQGLLGLRNGSTFDDAFRRFRFDVRPWDYIRALGSAVGAFDGYSVELPLRSVLHSSCPRAPAKFLQATDTLREAEKARFIHLLRLLETSAGDTIILEINGTTLGHIGPKYFDVTVASVKFKVGKIFGEYPKDFLLEANGFPKVVCLHHHVPPLSRLAELLSPGGRLLVPIYDPLPSTMLSGAERDSVFQFRQTFPDPPLPISRFTSTKLLREALSCNLTVVSAELAMFEDVEETLERWIDLCNDKWPHADISEVPINDDEVQRRRMCRIALEWELFNTRQSRKRVEEIGAAPMRAIAENEGWIGGGPGWGWVVLEKEA